MFIRRFSTKVLGALVVVLGIALTWFATFNISTYGSIGVGWTLDSVNFLGGSLRMLFPFTMGMFLSRIFQPVKVRGAFWIGSAALVALFSVPFIGPVEPLSMNGIYESFCIIIAFPILVWLGASGTTTDKISTAICKFLGDISFPLYVVHYPFMYLFYAWLIKSKLYTFGETGAMSLGVMAWNVLLAYACLKLYDEPARRYLAKRFLKKN